jgi:DDE superfamily endonuclease
MTSITTSRKRVQPPSTIDWDAIIDQLSINSGHGTITRVADRHGVSRSTVSRRWSIYCRAVEANDIDTQHAMRGYYDRRRDNRRALSWREERRAVTTLLETHPTPSRTDVSRALQHTHNTLPIMQRITRSTPKFHRTFSACPSTVSRVMRSHHLTDKIVRLRRGRVRGKSREEEEEEWEACVQYLEDVEEACRTHSPSLVINIDETSVRTVRPARTAVARKGWNRGRRPVLTVTRSDRESTSLVCAVAANGHLLQSCVLRGKRGEAALSKDSRWVTIQSGGWTDEAAYIEYVWRVILPYTRGRPATIVHDSLTAHNTVNVLAFLRTHQLSSIIVPAGHTSTLQPLDVGVFGPVKAKAQCRWREEKQRDRMRADTQLLSISLHVEALKGMSRQQLRRAWEKAVPALAR